MAPLTPVRIAAIVLALTIGGLVDVRAAHPAHAGAARSEAPSCPWSPDDCAFAAGYLDGGGPERYLRHLVEDVLPCEGEWGVFYANGYHSAFQFTGGTWAAAARATGFDDYMAPYHVGRNVAWLINDLERSGRSPGSTGGWPTCWWRGLVP